MTRNRYQALRGIGWTRRISPPKLRLVCWILWALLAQQDAAGQSSMRFFLAPESAWNDGRPAPEALLVTGKVDLYRQSGDEPSLSGRLGETLEVPRGHWTWIGEAPGLVTRPQSLTVPTRSPEDRRRTTKDVVRPAVPACDLALTGSWRGAERADAVSLSRNAVYPTVRPRAGLRRPIPAGEWIVYGVRGGQLTGLSAVGRCEPGEAVELPAPAPPPADRQDLVIHAVLPVAAGIDQEDSGLPKAALSGGDGGTVRAPTALFHTGRRATFFFRRLPVAGRQVILLHHPALRTVRESIDALGGSIRERTFELKPRPDLELGIDYRPRRDHHRAELEVLRCDERARIPTDCTRVTTRPLREGLNVYRIGDLDGGRYVVNARIDDEWVVGLGHGVEIEVTPDSPEVIRPAPVRLAEMEIWGLLLEDAEPVPGEVVLIPRVGELPERRAATGDDLFYHLFYFARELSDYDRQLLPDELASLNDEELVGLSYGTYNLHACSEAGSCRTLSLRTILLGSGRLDLDLGAPRGLVLRVVDGETGEPVPRAPVLVRGGDDRRLVFHAGDVWWLERAGAEALPRSTGGDGVARIRDLPSGEVRWMVKAAGYRAETGASHIRSRGFADTRVELTRIGAAGDVQLAYPDGTPVDGGYVLVFSTDGTRRPACGTPVSSNGRADFRTGCLESARLVLLHPEVRLAVLSGDDLATLGRATVERAPQPPPRLRVLDADGLPRTGRPVVVDVGGITLGPTELLAPLGSFRSPLFYLTDGNGEIELRGVDPFAPTPPGVGVLTAEGLEPVSFAGWRPGETLEVVLDR